MSISYNFILLTHRYSDTKLSLSEEGANLCILYCVKIGKKYFEIALTTLHFTQLCTVDLEVTDLERSTINLVPGEVFMESDTVLVQYLISSWSLQLRNSSEHM